jgi:hypothetical protein
MASLNATSSKTRRLLDELCVDLGFCLPPEQYARLSSSPPTSVGAFTDAVFAAEGLDPQLADRRLLQTVGDRIAKYFDELEGD